MPSVQDIFDNLSDQFDAGKAGDMDATVQFDLSGDNGGKWYVVVADGNVAVENGAAEAPTATIRMDADDYKAMMTGELNPMNAFMTGKVKVEGDLNTVMKFQTLFG